MKKIISAILSLLMLSSYASAWEGEAEYNQRNAYVNSSELELYVEGDREKAPYYGARLEPRSGIYFGTLADHCNFMNNFSTCLTYMEFDSMQEDMYYPANDMVKQTVQKETLFISYFLYSKLQKYIKK